MKSWIQGTWGKRCKGFKSQTGLNFLVPPEIKYLYQRIITRAKPLSNYISKIGTNIFEHIKYTENVVVQRNITD